MYKRQALEGLNKGDVSEVVESTYGYHIIKCTDYFHVDNQVDDIKQVPKDCLLYTSPKGYLGFEPSRFFVS